MRALFFVAAIGLTAISGCMSSEKEEPKTLILVSSNATYNAEQAHAICHSEALTMRASIRANQPTRVIVNTTPSGGGFAGGFADSFNKSFDPQPSSRRETEAAYSACAARLGYVVR